jgi:hypothetical protein
MEHYDVVTTDLAYEIGSCVLGRRRDRAMVSTSPFSPFIIFLLVSELFMRSLCENGRTLEGPMSHIYEAQGRLVLTDLISGFSDIHRLWLLTHRRHREPRLGF